MTAGGRQAPAANERKSAHSWGRISVQIDRLQADGSADSLYQRDGHALDLVAAPPAGTEPGVIGRCSPRYPISAPARAATRRAWPSSELVIDPVIEFSEPKSYSSVTTLTSTPPPPGQLSAMPIAVSMSGTSMIA
jgi:hypothetical protein